MANNCYLKFTIVESDKKLFEEKLKHVESIARYYVDMFWEDEEHMSVKTEVVSHDNTELYRGTISCDAKLKDWFNQMIDQIASPPIEDDIIMVFSDEGTHYYEKVLEVSKGGVFTVIYHHSDDVLCETCGSGKHYENW